MQRIAVLFVLFGSAFYSCNDVTSTASDSKNNQSKDSLSLDDSEGYDSLAQKPSTWFEWQITPVYREASVDSSISRVAIKITRGQQIDIIKIDSIAKIKAGLYQDVFDSPLSVNDGKSGYIELPDAVVIGAAGFYAGSGDEIYLVERGNDKYIVKWVQMGEGMDNPLVTDIMELTVPNDNTKKIITKSINLK